MRWTNQEIADEIDKVAKKMPAEDDQRVNSFTFRFGETTIRCRPTRPACEAVALKFRITTDRPRYRNIDPLPIWVTRKAFALSELKHFLRDGELSNACQYYTLHGKPEL